MNMKEAVELARTKYTHLRFVAMDADGDIWGFKIQPATTGFEPGLWCAPANGSAEIGGATFLGNSDNSEDWQSSLTEIAPASYPHFSKFRSSQLFPDQLESVARRLIGSYGGNAKDEPIIGEINDAVERLRAAGF